MKLTSTNLENPAPAPPPEPVPESAAEMPVWLQRIFVGVYVLFCIELGLVLIVLPWTRSGLMTDGLTQWGGCKASCSRDLCAARSPGWACSISGWASWRQCATVTGAEPALGQDLIRENA